MAQLFARPDWFDHAKCRGVDPAMFFPGHGENGSRAKKLCAVCPVTAECLEYAHQAPETWQHGVYGGYSSEERQRLGRRVTALCKWCAGQFSRADREAYCSQECRVEGRRMKIAESRLRAS